jgi:hypothetical protein
MVVCGTLGITLGTVALGLQSLATVPNVTLDTWDNILYCSTNTNEITVYYFLINVSITLFEKK